MATPAADGASWTGAKRIHRDGLVPRRALLIAGTAGSLLPLAGCSGSASGTHPAASPSGRAGAQPVAAGLAGGWATRRAPIVLAVMSTRTAQDAQPSDALIAQATRTVLPAL